jgi:hypothetical protein
MLESELESLEEQKKGREFLSVLTLIRFQYVSSSSLSLIVVYPFPPNSLSFALRCIFRVYF